MEQPSAGDAEKELTALNIKIGEAEKQRDEAFLECVLADDLIFRRANETVVRKKAYLEALQDAANTFDYIISEDVKPTVYEDVAVISLLVRAKGKRGPRTFQGTFRNIQIFLKKMSGNVQFGSILA
jgi:Domain of unknown function (DUF4440)